MREIKFRAWDSNYGGRMILWEELWGTRNMSIFGAMGYTLMQYTDLKDKNGKEIYEGDIVQWRWYGEDPVSGQLVKAKVVWDTYRLQWYARPNPLHRLTGKRDEPEIIGNIHENPELVKENTHS